MALTALPTIDSIVKTDDGSDTIIADSTVYGSPNADRNEVAVYLLPFKLNEDLEETALVQDDYDPETVTEFTVTNTTDGHQKYVQIIVDNYAGGTTYNQYDAVYYPTTGFLYKSKQSTPFSGVVPTNTTNWDVVTAQDLYEAIGSVEEATNVIVGIVQTVLTFSAQQCLTELAEDVAKEGCCDDCNNTKLKESFENLWLLVYVATISASRGKYTQGERFMREAETYCDCNC